MAMFITLRNVAAAALIATAFALVMSKPETVAAARADYPTRPIRLVVPYPAGGGNDVIARLVAAKMGPSLGQPIVIENRPGAGSTIGTRDVARSKPDGYTLLIATSALAINPSLYADAGYDPEKDFAAVGLIATSADLVLVRRSLPAHSIADLIALAKREPGKLNFASTGTGTSTHLAAELFAAKADVKLTAVPYKGVAPAVTDLLGEHVDLMFCPSASVVGLVREAKLRALAVTSARHSPLFAQLPTVAEAGVPGYQAELHYGIVAPAGTPAPVLGRLNTALNTALADTAVQGRLAVDGAETLAGTPAAYAADIAGERAKWSALLKQSDAARQ